MRPSPRLFTLHELREQIESKGYRSLDKAQQRAWRRLSGRMRADAFLLPPSSRHCINFFVPNETLRSAIELQSAQALRMFREAMEPALRRAA